MKPEWKAFLQDAGAEFDDGVVASFGNPSREREVTLSGNILSDLGHFGLIAAYGDEAGDFLHGQFSNDLRQVDAGHSQLSSYNSAKGRMLAAFRIFQRDDTYYLRMPRDVVESTLKRLRMFVMRAKVTLEDAGEAFARFGYAGPDAAQFLAEAFGPVPEQVDAVVTRGDVTVMRVPGSVPRFEIYGELDAMKTLWNKLDVDAAPVGTPCWRLLDILAGQPNIYAPTLEAFVPQMVNLERIGGVNFKKGCYPGQEVVARMHYLGKPNRRMFLAAVDANGCPAPGDKLHAAAEEQAVGDVVDAVMGTGGECLMLVVVKLKAREAGTIHLGSADGPQLQFRDLPYSLEDEAA